MRIEHRVTVLNENNERVIGFAIGGTQYDKLNIARVLYALDNMKYEETDDIPTNMDEFSILLTGVGVEPLEVRIVYDYLLKQEYVWIGGEWHRITEMTAMLNNIILPDINYAMPSGIARYQDDDHHIFRYEHHWNPSYDWRREGKYNYRESMFNNTEPAEIKDKDDAIARAAKELGFDNPVAIYYYDETCGYWMIELYDDIGYDTTSREFRDALDDIVKTVIMDDKGITLEVYTNPTTTYLFMPIPEIEE